MLHIPVVLHRIFHLRMVKVTKHKFAIGRKRRKTPSFRNSRTVHGTDGIQLIYNRKKISNGMVAPIAENIIQPVGPVKPSSCPQDSTILPNSVA